MGAITNFEYTTDLYLRRKREGDGKLFYLDRDYAVQFKLDGVLTVVVVPGGLDTDLASIPDVVPNWIAKRIDAHIEAAVVHDWLYSPAGRRFSRETSDDIFLAGMVAAGVDERTRNLMYAAVRMFGGIVWGRRPTPEWAPDPGTRFDGV